MLNAVGILGKNRKEKTSLSSEQRNGMRERRTPQWTRCTGGQPSGAVHFVANYAALPQTLVALRTFFVPYSEGDFVTTVFLWQVEAVCIATDNIACAGLEVGTWWVVFCPGSKRGNVGGTGAVAEVRRRNLPVEFFLMQISCGLKHPVGRGEQVSECSLTAIKPVLTSN